MVESKLKDIQQLYKVDIPLAYGQLESVMDWCRLNCRHTWHVEESPTGTFILTKNGGWQPDTYQFMFTDEVDFITFNLKYR